MHVRAMVSQRSAKLCMMSGQSSSPVMHDACEDLGQNYLKADIMVVAGQRVDPMS